MLLLYWHITHIYWYHVKAIIFLNMVDCNIKPVMSPVLIYDIICNTVIQYNVNTVIQYKIVECELFSIVE